MFNRLYISFCGSVAHHATNRTIYKAVGVVIVLYLDYQFLLPKNPPIYRNIDTEGELQRLIPCPSSTVGDHISNFELLQFFLQTIRLQRLQTS